MFDNSVFLKIKENLNEQRKKIYEEEYLLFNDWINNLNLFLGDDKNGFLIVNDSIYIKYDSIDSKIFNTFNISEPPLYYYRLYGLTVSDSGKSIDTTFSHCISINIKDKIKKCTEKEFFTQLNMCCEKIFNNSEENFNFQYKCYTSRFYDYILKSHDYFKLFPDYVHDFLNKLEERYNQEDL